MPTYALVSAMVLAAATAADFDTQTMVYRVPKEPVSIFVEPRSCMSFVAQHMPKGNLKTATWVQPDGRVNGCALVESTRVVFLFEDGDAGFLPIEKFGPGVMPQPGTPT